MERLQAKDAILEVIFSMAQASDELDMTLQAKQFRQDETFILDVSGHLKGMPAKAILPSELAEQTCKVLSGFTSTQHLVGNPVITLHGSTPSAASVVANFCAYHCLLEESGDIRSVTARGRWEMELEKDEDKWVIRRFGVVRTCPVDASELALYDEAKNRAERGQGRKIK